MIKVYTSLRCINLLFGRIYIKKKHNISLSGLIGGCLFLLKIKSDEGKNIIKTPSNFMLNKNSRN